MDRKGLTVKEFIKLLEKQDMNKTICVFNTISSIRVPITVDDIDWNLTDVLDIDLVYALTC